MTVHDSEGFISIGKEVQFIQHDIPRVVAHGALWVVEVVMLVERVRIRQRLREVTVDVDAVL